MNYIGLSLFGKDEIYFHGLLRFLDSAKVLMPEFIPVVFMERKFPIDKIVEISNRGAKCFFQDETWHSNGTFWRFMTFQIWNANHVVIRDVDSDLLERDVAAINEWIASDKDFHIIRDHPFHKAEIMGGMWGARASYMRPLLCGHKWVTFTNDYGEDQRFLAGIYPEVVAKSLVHDSFHSSEPEPIRNWFQRSHGEFIGERLNERGEPLFPEDREICILAEKKILEKRLGDKSCS